MIAVMIATLIMSGYLAYIVKCFGIPRSLSDTFYLLGDRGWIFQVVLGLFGALLMPTWIDLSSGNTQFLAFLACAGLLFVAAAPCFKIDIEGKVHYTSAMLCCVCAFVWQIVEMGWLFPVGSLAVALGITVSTKGNPFWWVELAVMLSSVLSILIKL